MKIRRRRAEQKQPPVAPSASGSPASPSTRASQTSTSTARASQTSTSTARASQAGADAHDDHSRRKKIGAFVALGATSVAFVAGATTVAKNTQLQALEKGRSISADPFPTTAPDLPADPKDLVVTAPAPTTSTTAPAPPPVVERGPLQPNLDGVFAATSHEVRQLAPGVHHHALRGNMGGPQVVHVVEIDLNRPEYDVTSNRSEERNMTVSQWAARTKPVVVVNADFFDMATRQPRGLAVADGVQWPGTGDLPDHTVMGCTAEDVCTFDAENEVKHDPAWQDAVGMNGARLIVDGVVRQHPGAFYETDRHPRSAVGLTDDRRMLLVAIEGRMGDAAGATWNETSNLLSRFGTVVQAGMLDGGGSTAIAHVDDAGGVHRLNRVPGGAERAVANVLAIRSTARG